MNKVTSAIHWIFNSWKGLVATLAASIVTSQLWDESLLSVLLTILASILVGVWLVRVVRWSLRRVLWRVRNRLIISYALIALIPFLLLGLLAFAGVWMLTTQVAGFTVNQALDKRAQTLVGFVDTIQLEGPYSSLSKLGSLMDRTTPNLQVVVEEGARRYAYPNDVGLAIPQGLPNWGMIRVEESFFLFASNFSKDRRVFAVAPLTDRFLSEMIPGLGAVQIVTQLKALKSNGQKKTQRLTLTGAQLSADSNLQRYDVGQKSLFDVRVFSFTQRPYYRLSGTPSIRNSKVTAVGAQLGKTLAESSGDEVALINVATRPSAVYDLVTKAGIGGGDELLQSGFAVIAIFFLILAAVAVTIGVTLTRSLTNAVHGLYQGTTMVQRGDFSHRIQISGRDQLAELGRSFNTMTENLESLLAVAKEKERLQSELEIAREVQNQLYPRKIPQTPKLHLAAVCNPARLVSGDYYDFQKMGDRYMAIAMGDVSGKGISAALLMATLQSSFRSQVRHESEISKLTETGPCPIVSTASFMGAINKHMFANTPPEKFATFFLGVFDEETSCLSYTNAGHLPPMLIRDGEATRLDVNGLIVGAFPFAKYEQAHIDLRRGDLLVSFTDGVSEPENEFGEMFGEDRLMSLLKQNSHRSDQQILEVVLDSVEQWTKSKVLQDDITLVLLRHV
jgi:phosphoserine phosphatase RsbU/P